MEQNIIKTTAYEYHTSVAAFAKAVFAIIINDLGGRERESSGLVGRERESSGLVGRERESSGLVGRERESSGLASGERESSEMILCK